VSVSPACWRFPDERCDGAGTKKRSQIIPSAVKTQQYKAHDWSPLLVGRANGVRHAAAETDLFRVTSVGVNERGASPTCTGRTGYPGRVVVGPERTIATGQRRRDPSRRSRSRNSSRCEPNRTAATVAMAATGRQAILGRCCSVRCPGHIVGLGHGDPSSRSSGHEPVRSAGDRAAVAAAARPRPERAAAAPPDHHAATPVRPPVRPRPGPWTRGRRRGAVGRRHRGWRPRRPVSPRRRAAGPAWQDRPQQAAGAEGHRRPVGNRSSSPTRKDCRRWRARPSRPARDRRSGTRWSPGG